MNTYLFSIHPKWCEKIFSGEKTIEVRKSAPKPPFKVVVYCTRGSPYLALVSGRGTAQLFACCDWKTAITFGGEIGNGKVIGEFVCNEVDKYKYEKTKEGVGKFTISEKDFKDMAIDGFDLFDYADGKDIYGLHISDLKIYDEPKELGEFYKPCIMPEMPYCPACKYGNVRYLTIDELIEYYSPDEVECASDLEGASCEWLCLNKVKRPPQSWQYIEEK